MSDKKYSSTKKFLKRSRKDIEIFESLSTDTLSKIATGEIDAVVLSTIVLGRRMVLRYTKNGDVKIKI